MAPETPRAVSSRLLTMKFMQRAAASSSAASSPDSNTPSSKKRKLDHSPTSGRIDLNIDEASIKAALEDQEAKRQAALRKHTAGDTHWVLNSTPVGSSVKPLANPPLNIVYVGYGDVDSENESGDNCDAPAQGRTSTKDYKKAAQSGKPQRERESDAEDDSSEDSSSEADDATPGRKTTRSRDARTSSATKRSRSRSQSRPGVENTKAKEFRDKRKKKEVRLSKLTSISSAGGSPLSSQSSKGMTCYNCRQVGHRAADCPKK